MAVTYRDRAQAFSTASSTNIVVPATVQAGDLLLLQAVGGWVPSIPAGWTQEYANSGSNIGSFVASKIATAGDIGATITVTWNNAYNNVVNLIAVTGSTVIRTPESHLWSSGGGTGTPNSQSAAAGDLVVYLGGNRGCGGPPSLSRGTVAISGADGALTAAGVVGYESLATDQIVSATFTSPSNGSGYEYSVLVISGGGTPPTSRIVSRSSVIALTNDSVNNRILSRQSATVLGSDTVNNRILSRMNIQVLVPTEPRYRGWGVKK